MIIKKKKTSYAADHIPPIIDKELCWKELKIELLQNNFFRKLFRFFSGNENKISNEVRLHINICKADIIESSNPFNFVETIICFTCFLKNSQSPNLQICFTKIYLII